MAHSVFIDGAAGTTGLEIRDRLTGRSEFELVHLPDERRKDVKARREAINDSDFVILCLPDEAAREAVSLVENDRTRVIDASSAHRTAEGWAYGFPELNPVQREAIAGAKRVSNPGCYPTGFLALIAPLVEADLLPRDWPYSCHAVSGYSGGGKALIERFDAEPDLAFRAYGLALDHKHVPEMQKYAGLTQAPVFAPAVVNAFRGMVVEVPLPLAAMPVTASVSELRAALEQHYAATPLVRFHQGEPPTELLIRQGAVASDRLDLYLFASADEKQLRAVATIDNLCKGASGAAVQSLNLMADLDETAGLRL